MTVTGNRLALAVIAALAVALSGMAGLLLSSAGAQAAATTLCQEQTATVAGGSYTVANNEFGSGARECITTGGNAAFAVVSSSIGNAADGPPGAYPSIYQGCHWGHCSSGGLAATPVRVSSLNAGRVTTSWSTAQPGGSSAYDVAYDIWFNKTPAASGQPNCAEMMIWLNHNGSVQPFGSRVASGVTVGGHSYTVWEGQQPTWHTITYDMTAPARSVSHLDVGALARDAVGRGFLPRSCYLIDVEAGFELWRGGAGLATTSFSVRVAGGTRRAPTPARAGRCSASYSVVSTWPGGFQAQVLVRGTGPRARSGWRLGWRFPGDQRITSLWNGSVTQSGQSVTVRNAAYNGMLDAGGTVTVGFTGTFIRNGSPPTSVSCR